jgi:hypothetical protein
VLALVSLSLVLMLMAAGLYHWVFLKGARERWPVVGTLVRFVVQDEFEQRDRFMRENLDAMARRLGEMQARMVQLEALGERVSGLAGVNTAELKANPGRGGALIEGRPLSVQELPSTAARPSTPDWTSRPSPVRPSRPLRAAWWSRRKCIRNTATWWKWTMATT